MAVTLYDEQNRSYPTEVIRVRGADVRLLADNTVTLEARPAASGGGGGGGTTVIGAARGVFPIQDYNPSLDGVTDDTDAWNRAVTAAWLAGGGVVQWLESGTSVVNKVKLRDNVTLRLGDQSTLKLNPVAVSGDFVVGNDDFTGGNVGISVEGGRYDGNSAAFAIGPNITTMQFQKVPGLSIRDCYVTGGIAEGVYVFSSNDIEISNLAADHCGKVAGGVSDGSGLHVNECQRVKLTGVAATYCGFHGVYVNGCQEVSGDVYAAHNNIDGVRVNAGYAVNLTVDCVENVQRGLYANLGCYGCTLVGTFVGNGWHNLVANSCYSCAFFGTAIDSPPGFQDVYFTADTDELSWYGRSRKNLNEGPATNVFMVAGTFAAAAHTHVAADITNFAAAVAATPPAAHAHAAAEVTSGQLARARMPTGNAYADVDNAFTAPQTMLTTGQNAMLTLTRVTGAGLYLQAQAAVAVVASVGAFPLRLASNSTVRFDITAGGHLLPAGDAVSDIGDATHQIRDIFSSRNSKLAGLVRIGTQTINTGLVIGDQSQTTINGAGSQVGLDVYADFNTSAAAINFVNRSPGTSAGLVIQYIFGDDTSPTPVQTRAGFLEFLKSGAWTSGNNATKLSDFRVRTANGNGSVTEAFRVKSGGFVTSSSDGASFVAGASGNISLAAVAGFLYVPTCAGTPTGVPTAFNGKSALVYDTAANKLWVYNGAWRSIALT